MVKTENKIFFKVLLFLQFVFASIYFLIPLLYLVRISYRLHEVDEENEFTTTERNNQLLTLTSVFGFVLIVLSILYILQNGYWKEIQYGSILYFVVIMFICVSATYVNAESKKILSFLFWLLVFMIWAFITQGNKFLSEVVDLSAKNKLVKLFGNMCIHTSIIWNTILKYYVVIPKRSLQNIDVINDPSGVDYITNWSVQNSKIIVQPIVMVVQLCFSPHGIKILLKCFINLALPFIIIYFVTKKDEDEDEEVADETDYPLCLDEDAPSASSSNKLLMFKDFFVLGIVFLIFIWICVIYYVYKLLFDRAIKDIIAKSILFTLNIFKIVDFDEYDQLPTLKIYMTSYEGILYSFLSELYKVKTFIDSNETHTNRAKKQIKLLGSKIKHVIKVSNKMIEYINETQYNLNKNIIVFTDVFKNIIIDNSNFFIYLYFQLETDIEKFNKFIAENKPSDGESTSSEQPNADGESTSSEQPNADDRNSDFMYIYPNHIVIEQKDGTSIFEPIKLEVIGTTLDEIQKRKETRYIYVYDWIRCFKKEKKSKTKVPPIEKNYDFLKEEKYLQLFSDKITSMRESLIKLNDDILSKEMSNMMLNMVVFGIYLFASFILSIVVASSVDDEKQRQLYMSVSIISLIIIMLFARFMLYFLGLNNEYLS